MADRQAYPPPVKCSATARRTGQRCERWAVPGRLQCKLHGAHAGRAGKAVAEERAGAVLTLAQMMANNPGRPVWETILDSIRTVDVIAQAAAQDVAAGRVTTAEGIERVVSYARSAHAMASSVMATRALEAYTAHTDRWGDAVSARMSALLTDWMGLPADLDGQVSRGVVALFGAFDPNEPGTTPRPDGPPLLDIVGQAVAAALAPRLGVPVTPLTRWFRQVVEAVDRRDSVPAPPVGALAALPVAPLPERRPDPLEALAELVPPDDRVKTPSPMSGFSTKPEPEPEVLDGELVEDQPKPEPSRIWDPVRRIMRRNPNYVRSARTSAVVPADVVMPSSHHYFN